MGNCQAIDAAALVIQHPSGRLEKMYWPVSAVEVTRMNPGHHICLIIPRSISEEEERKNDRKTIRLNRVKLLKPTDTLVLGHAYQLVTTQEVMRVLRAKKNAKLKKNKPESAENDDAEPGRSESSNSNQAIKHEKLRRKTNLVAARSRSWRPSLHSISETGVDGNLPLPLPITNDFY